MTVCPLVAYKFVRIVDKIPNTIVNTINAFEFMILP